MKRVGEEVLEDVIVYELADDPNTNKRLQKLDNSCREKLAARYKRREEKKEAAEKDLKDFVITF